MEIQRILFRIYSDGFPHPPRTHTPEPPEPPDRADVTAAIFHHKLEIGDKHALGCLYDDVIRDLEVGTTVNRDTLLLLLRGLKRPDDLPKQAEYRVVFDDIFARMVFNDVKFYTAVKQYHQWVKSQNNNSLNSVQRALRFKSFDDAFELLKKQRTKYI